VKQRERVPDHKAPAAEIVVDSNLARALLRTQHPDLSEFPLEEVAQGWDNFIFRLGATMAWLRGETADLAPLKADQAKPLARFLHALHSTAPADAPKNPTREWRSKRELRP
jgi:hypothetical protein